MIHNFDDSRAALSAKYNAIPNFNGHPPLQIWYSPASAHGIAAAVTPSFLVLGQIGARAASVTHLMTMPAFVRPTTALLFFFDSIFCLRELCVASLGATPITGPLMMTLWTLPPSMPYLPTHSTSVHPLCGADRHFLHVPQLRAEMSSVSLFPTLLAWVLHSCMHIPISFSVPIMVTYSSATRCCLAQSYYRTTSTVIVGPYLTQQLSTLVYYFT